jgi:hypothetical protein
MTKRRRRHPSRRGVAWPLLVFGGILLLAAVFLFAKQVGGASDGGGNPKIAVDLQKIQTATSGSATTSRSPSGLPILAPARFGSKNSPISKCCRGADRPH